MTKTDIQNQALQNAKGEKPAAYEGQTKTVRMNGSTILMTYRNGGWINQVIKTN